MDIIPKPENADIGRIRVSFSGMVWSSWCYKKSPKKQENVSHSPLCERGRWNKTNRY